MTNTKFRKRALLSSVAMLLVALVALGSATFAWFVNDPNASASGIKAQANTALGLLVKTDTDSNWSHSAELYKSITDDSILVPATTIDGSTYWTAQAAAASASGIKTGDTSSKWSSVTVADHEKSTGGVYKEKVYLKVTGGATATVTLNSVTLSLKDQAMKGAVTVLVAKQDGTILGEWNETGTSISKWTTLTASTQTAAANGTAVTAKASGTGDLSIGNINGTGTQYVTVYVYLDGANSSVYTDNAHANELIDGVTLSFTAVAA